MTYNNKTANTERNVSAHKTPLRKGRKVGEFMTADPAVVSDFRESADNEGMRASVSVDRSTGKKMWICVLFAMLAFGCAAKPAPVVQSPYEACYQQAKVDTAAAAATTAVIAAETTDKVLEYLQVTEKYLQGKVEEFKASHPELVAKGEEELAALRQKIAEYKEKLSKKLAIH